MYSAGTTSAHVSTNTRLIGIEHTCMLFSECKFTPAGRPEIHLALDVREVLWFQHTFPEFATFKTLPGCGAVLTGSAERF